MKKRKKPVADRTETAASEIPNPPVPDRIDTVPCPQTPKPQPVLTQKEKKAARKAEAKAYESAVNRMAEKDHRRRLLYAALSVTVLFGVILVSCILHLYQSAAAVNEIFGYILLFLLLAATVWFFVRPVFSMFAARPLTVTLDGSTIEEATAHNARVLKKAATNILRYHKKELGPIYVAPDRLSALEEHIKTDDRVAFCNFMSDFYSKEVSKKANAIIHTSMMKVAVSTAVSQSDWMDALASLFLNLSMIRQIVATYGFRPGSAGILRIYWTVIKNSIGAYCLENIPLFPVANKICRGLLDKIPLLSTVFDSGFQGLTNAFLTDLVGRKTKRYLYGDYRRSADLNNNGIDDDCEAAVEDVRALKKDIEESKNKATA